MTDLTHVGLRVAALGALLDAVKAEYNAARGEAVAGLKEARPARGQKDITVDLPGVGAVASVTLREPKPTVDVDGDAFLDWVCVHHSGEVVPAVRESFRRAVMARLQIDGDDVFLVDSETGERATVDWATVVPAAEASSISLTYRKGGRDAIRAAWRNRELPFGPLAEIESEKQ